jgi:Uma2 family endonuclease
MAVMAMRMIDSVPEGEYVPSADERLVMHDVSWQEFETMLALRGDRRRPRVAYLDGVLELMSPSHQHEWIKSNIGRLIEAVFFEYGYRFNIFGEWLLKRREDEAGVEPDECYCFDPAGRAPKERPDLVIQVVWTSGGVNKLEIYRRLAVPEIWFWRKNAIEVYVLGANGYERSSSSACVPQVDLGFICELLARPDAVTSELIQEMRSELANRRAK